MSVGIGIGIPAGVYGDVWVSSEERSDIEVFFEARRDAPKRYQVRVAPRNAAGDAKNVLEGADSFYVQLFYDELKTIRRIVIEESIPNALYQNNDRQTRVIIDLSRTGVPRRLYERVSPLGSRELYFDALGRILEERITLSSLGKGGKVIPTQFYEQRSYDDQDIEIERSVFLNGQFQYRENQTLPHEEQAGVFSSRRHLWGARGELIRIVDVREEIISSRNERETYTVRRPSGEVVEIIEEYIQNKRLVRRVRQAREEILYDYDEHGRLIKRTHWQLPRRVSGEVHEYRYASLSGGSMGMPVFFKDLTLYVIADSRFYLDNAIHEQYQTLRLQNFSALRSVNVRRIFEESALARTIDKPAASSTAIGVTSSVTNSAAISDTSEGGGLTGIVGIDEGLSREPRAGVVSGLRVGEAKNIRRRSEQQFFGNHILINDFVNNILVSRSVLTRGKTSLGRYDYAYDPWGRLSEVAFHRPGQGLAEAPSSTVRILYHENKPLTESVRAQQRAMILGHWRGGGHSLFRMLAQRQTFKSPHRAADELDDTALFQKFLEDKEAVIAEINRREEKIRVSDTLGVSREDIFASLMTLIRAGLSRILYINANGTVDYYVKFYTVPIENDQERLIVRSYVGEPDFQYGKTQVLRRFISAENESGGAGDPAVDVREIVVPKGEREAFLTDGSIPVNEVYYERLVDEFTFDLTSSDLLRAEFEMTELARRRVLRDGLDSSQDNVGQDNAGQQVPPATEAGDAAAIGIGRDSTAGAEPPWWNGAFPHTAERRLYDNRLRLRDEVILEGVTRSADFERPTSDILEIENYLPRLEAELLQSIR